MQVGELVALLDLDDSKFGSKLGGVGEALGGVGKLALAAGATAGAALVGAAVEGVKAFSGFQDSMNEVFTLLPGLSQSAMDDMSQHVKDFSKEFGVLPDKEIPALYQAISAGVPQGNLFDFLATAQKAAKGGVTDLETAVDGITSTINAYGTKTLSAAQASDVMFTAVKQGKTTFDELSKSLFNVNPIAASVGLKFGDVAAGLATMTAQGVPTAVATTQLRQLFVELSKDGQQAADTFKQISGKSFKDYIASGHSLQDAMNVMGTAATKNHKSIADMFSSVEAGGAALTLTGKGADTFTANLKAMNSSAGATEKAYAQMQTGLSASWDRIKASANVAMIDLGEKLAPSVAKLANLFEDAMPRIAKVTGTAMATVTSALGPVVKGARDFFDGFTKGTDDVGSNQASMAAWGAATFGTFAAAQRGLDAFMGGWENPKAGNGVKGLTGQMITFGQKTKDVFDDTKKQVAGFGDALDAGAKGKDFLSTGPIEQFGETLGSVFNSISNVAQEFFGSFEKWVNTHQATLDVWQQKISTIFGTISTIIQDAFQVIQIVFQVVTGVIGALWDAFGDHLLAHLGTAFNAILQVIGGVFEVIKGIFDVFIGIFTGNWGRAWDGVKEIFGGVWNAIVGIVKFAINLVSTVIGLGMAALSIAWQIVWDGIKTIASGVWDGIKALVGGGVDWVVKTVTGIKDTITKGMSGAFDGLKDAFRGALNYIIGKWNDFSLKIPEIDTHIPGIGKVGGFTIDTPNLPLLGNGGIAMTPGMAIVGERGPELMYLNRGASIQPLDQSSGQKGDTYVDVSFHGINNADDFLDAMPRLEAAVRAGVGR